MNAIGAATLVVYIVVAVLAAWGVAALVIYLFGPGRRWWRR